MACPTPRAPAGWRRSMEARTNRKARMDAPRRNGVFMDFRWGFRVSHDCVLGGEWRRSVEEADAKSAGWQMGGQCHAKAVSESATLKSMAFGECRRIARRSDALHHESIARRLTCAGEVECRHLACPLVRRSTTIFPDPCVTGDSVSGSAFMPQRVFEELAAVRRGKRQIAGFRNFV